MVRNTHTHTAAAAASRLAAAEEEATTLFAEEEARQGRRRVQQQQQRMEIEEERGKMALMTSKIGELEQELQEERQLHNDIMCVIITLLTE